MSGSQHIPGTNNRTSTNKPVLLKKGYLVGKLVRSGWLTSDDSVADDSYFFFQVEIFQPGTIASLMFTRFVFLHHGCEVKESTGRKAVDWTKK